VPKTRDPSKPLQAAIQQMLHDPDAKLRAAEFAKVVAQWDGPKLASELLFEEFGKGEQTQQQP
jgi:hypothetical protein